MCGWLCTLYDLRKLFKRLVKYKLRLNPNKCVFCASLGKLLSFIVSQRGIEADPAKVKAIRDMPTSKTKKQVRNCLGRINCIARFIWMVQSNKNIKKILVNMINTYKDWHEFLPFSLCAYRTSVRTSMGATLYFLVYGMGAVLPAKVEIPSLRIISQIELLEAEWAYSQYKQLNMIDEKCMTAMCHGQLYQRCAERVFNKKVRRRVFEEGDLVLKKCNQAIPNHRGKFASTYEGPYVVKAFFEGALILANMDGHDFNMPTNSNVVLQYFAWESLIDRLSRKTATTIPSFDHPLCQQLPRAQGPIGGPFSMCDVVHVRALHGALGALSLSLWRKVGLPLALWQEPGPNFRWLPKVSGIAINHWVFLRCDWSPVSSWFYYQSRLRKMEFFLI